MVRFGTYIPRDSYYKLRELTGIYGSQTSALEKAINLLYEVSRFSTKIDAIIIRERLINEFDNMLISRPNLVHILKGELKKVYEESFISAILQGFFHKDIRANIELDEILEAIKKVYIKGNRWFTNIDLRRNKEVIEVAFFHNLCIEFSDFASKYFSNFFESLGYRTLDIDKWQKLFIIKMEKI